VYPSMNIVNSNRVQLSVMNVSKKDIILKQPHRIAQISSCESVGPRLKLDVEDSETMLIMLNKEYRKYQIIGGN